MAYGTRWYGSVVAALAVVGCGDDTVSPGGAESSTSGAPATSSTGEEGSSTGGGGSSSSAADSTGVESSSSSDSSSDTTTGGLAACAPEAFTYPTTGSLTDLRCTGGARCEATATCSLLQESLSEGPFGGYIYTLSCDGDWTNIYDAGKETETLVGVEVTLYSLHQLELGDTPFDYRVSSDFADRFGGIDSTISRLERDGEVLVAAASGEGGFGVAGFNFFTDETTACDSDSLTIGYVGCIYQRGLEGPGPGGARIELLAGEALMGEELEFVGSTSGWDVCKEEFLYRMSARAGLVSVTLLAEPYDE